MTPSGEDKVQLVSRKSQDTDEILLDNDYVTVTRTGYDVSDSLTMDIYIESKTDNPIMVSIEDCALNGTMCDPFWANTVQGNKVSCSTVEWYDTTLEDSNLTAEDVTEITFTLRVYNDDTYEDYASEKITLKK